MDYCDRPYNYRSSQPQMMGRRYEIPEDTEVQEPTGYTSPRGEFFDCIAFLALLVAIGAIISAVVFLVMLYCE